MRTAADSYRRSSTPTDEKRKNNPVTLASLGWDKWRELTARTYAGIRDERAPRGYMPQMETLLRFGFREKSTGKPTFGYPLNAEHVKFSPVSPRRWWTTTGCPQDTLVGWENLVSDFVWIGATAPDLFIVEGQWDSMALTELNYPAVALINNSQRRVSDAICKELRRAGHIFLLPDNDGLANSRAAVESVKAQLDKEGLPVSILEFPGDIKDVCQFWKRFGADALREYLTWQTDALKGGCTITFRTADLSSPFVVGTTENREVIAEAEPPFPADIGAEVFDACAVLKDFVDLTLPHVEADVNNLAADFLACAGSVLGAKVYGRVAFDLHPPGTFHLLLGGTGIGKGTAQGATEHLFLQVEKSWYNVIRRSARSGQALVRMLKEVSEPTIEYTAEDGQPPQTKENPKYTQGRMFLCFSEVASLFASLKMESSVLSQYLRDAYDCRPLANEKGDGNASSAVNAPYTLTVLGSITPWELARILADVDFANGLANRFVWWASQSSKVLPRAERAPDYTELARRIARLIPTAPVGQIRYSKDGAEEWDAWVSGLPRGDSKLDSACARMRPNALRLAVLFAVLDESRLTLEGTPLEIHAHHVRAAAAIMERHRASVDWYLSRKMLVLPSPGNGSKESRVRDLAAANGGRFTGAQLARLFSNQKPDERESIAVAAGFKKHDERDARGNKIAVWT